MRPQDFLSLALQAAQDSGHVFPAYAACEAALESGWGESKLATVANNLFGMKQPKDPNATQYPVLSLPTKEFLNNEEVTVNALWPMYPSWGVCFSERMNTLRRVSIYAPALAATTGEDFVRLVSQHWSTDPERANKVLQIYRAHGDLLDPTLGNISSGGQTG
jgi:flagellum-specific peptidoglycan hydrolase FlgJ